MSKVANGIADSVDPDHTAPSGGLLCLLKLIYPNI